MAAKQSRLGRGIGAILEEVEEAYAADIRGNNESIMELQIEEIEPNPFQPRTNFDPEALRELADSIKNHGLLQPIVVVKRDGKFVLIAGERRLRASKLLGNETIRAIVADISYSKLRELALIENIQRENLNPIELAHSFKELIDEHSLTHEALAEMVGKSRAYVTNMLRLLQLGDYAKEALLEDKISYGHGKVLVGLDLNEEKKIIDSIINQKLSVRETESLINGLKQSAGTQKAKVTPNRSIEPIDLEDTVLSLKARGFSAKHHKNQLIVVFDSNEQARNFLSILER